jgi:ABC-type transporter Mla subunit MlaD
VCLNSSLYTTQIYKLGVDNIIEANQKSTSPPIMDNNHVQELLAIMSENNAPVMKDFIAVLTQVTAMERQLDTAVSELAAMRKQLAEVQSKNHPLKETMQKSVTAMQNHVSNMRDKLAEIKENIVDGCKNAVSAFKEKGISALNNIAQFFNIKPALESMQNGLDKAIERGDKAVNKIETISQEYHAAGRALKNIGRAFLGKEPIQEARPIGVVAKAFIAPHSAGRKCFEGMKKHISAAIDSVEKLEKRANERKPSVLNTIAKYEKKVEQNKKDAPALDLSKPKPAKDER